MKHDANYIKKKKLTFLSTIVIISHLFVQTPVTINIHSVLQTTFCFLLTPAGSDWSFTADYGHESICWETDTVTIFNRNQQWPWDKIITIIDWG